MLWRACIHRFQAARPQQRIAVKQQELTLNAAPIETDRGEPFELDGRLYQLNKVIIDTVKGAIDVVYANNDFARFYVLETVARVP